MPDQIKQVGGTHYQDATGTCPHCGGAIQHWDLCAKMPYLVGSATKYIVRFLGKDGFEGLKKAISYVEKMMAVYYPKEYEEYKHESLRTEDDGSVLSERDVSDSEGARNASGAKKPYAADCRNAVDLARSAENVAELGTRRHRR